MSEMDRLEARLRALGAVAGDGADWEDVLKQAGERFSSPRFGRRRLVLALAVVATVVLALVAALFAVGGTRPPQTGSNGAKGATGIPVGPTNPTPGPTGRKGPTGVDYHIVVRPIGLSVHGLRAESRALATPIYWAGPADGDVYEFTRTPLGHLYVRYLPPGVHVGTWSAKFLTVATDPLPGAFQALKQRTWGKTIAGPDGSIIFVRADDPEIVSLAFPNVDEEIVIYGPSAAVALATAKSGDIRPVG